MRKKIVTGNWKMNKTPSDAVALVEQLKDKIDMMLTLFFVCHLLA